MPALPAIVDNYIDGLIEDLQRGNPLDLLSPNQTYSAGLNFLRAMDVATALELLQNALTTGTLTVVSGTTTSLTDGAATFVASQQIGNYVVFDGNVTAALAGVEARVISNTTTTLTFGETLPGTPAVGDTYTIVGGCLEEEIAAIRAGKSLGDGTVPIYADSRLVNHALVKLITQLGDSVSSPLMASMTASSGTTTSVVVDTSARGANMRIDEFKNMDCTVAAKGTLRVVNNTEDTLYLAGELSSAAASSDAVTIRRPVASSAPQWNRVPFSGGHPDNGLFADLLSQAQASVVAYTLPT